MSGGIISRVSAGFLAFAGLSLLFAADQILSRHIPGFPTDGYWFGQLLGAACLAMANLNWLSRRALLGGIYGRPVVAANAVGYFIAAMVMLKPMLRGEFSAGGWLIVVPVTALAVAYGWLMLRGPFAQDAARKAEAG